MNIENTLRISRLLCVYDALLTEKQQQIVRAYVDYNGSLGEIACEFGVTRQAAFDLLKRTIKKLEEYEEKLNICEKLDKICDAITKITKHSLTKKEQDDIIKIIKELEG